MNSTQAASSSAFRPSGLKIRSRHDQYISIRESLMDVLIHRVPSVLPSHSIGKAKHDLCPLSHEEAFTQFREKIMKVTKAINNNKANKENLVLKPYI